MSTPVLSLDSESPCALKSVKLLDHSLGHLMFILVTSFLSLNLVKTLEVQESS